METDCNDFEKKSMCYISRPKRLACTLATALLGTPSDVRRECASVYPPKTIISPAIVCHLAK